MILDFTYRQRYVVLSSKKHFFGNLTSIFNFIFIASISYKKKFKISFWAYNFLFKLLCILILSLELNSADNQYVNGISNKRTPHFFIGIVVSVKLAEIVKIFTIFGFQHANRKCLNGNEALKVILLLHVFLWEYCYKCNAQKIRNSKIKPI